MVVESRDAAAVLSSSGRANLEVEMAAAVSGVEVAARRYSEGNHNLSGGMI